MDIIAFSNSDDFYFFLTWLADEKAFSGREVAEVACFPHKYKAEIVEYKENN
jgi:hypothetical protein